MTGRGKTEQAYRDGLKVLALLEQAGYTARFAGGSVRDRLMQREPKDFDVATDALPDQVAEIFKEKGAKVIPTGLDHGTVTVLMRRNPIEVTSLRRDLVTDGRRAKVAFGTSFEEDAQRRDFTINAMYEDRNGQVYDYFSGQKDIVAKRLRFVGDAKNRIQEDYLRILRLFRFWSRLGFQPDEETLQTVSELTPGLNQISQERITSEVFEILSGEAVLESLEAMHRCTIFEQILPGLKELPKAQLVALKNSEVSEDEKGLCMFATLLLGVQGAAADLSEICKRWRLSKRQAEKLAVLLSPVWIFPDTSLNNGELMEWIDQWEARAGIGFVQTVLVHAWMAMFPEKLAMINRLGELEEQHGARRRQELPVSGHDLRKLLQPGPELGALVKRLRIAFRNQEWQSKQEGLNLCQNWIKADSRH